MSTTVSCRIPWGPFLHTSGPLAKVGFGVPATFASCVFWGTCLPLVLECLILCLEGLLFTYWTSKCCPLTDSWCLNHMLRIISYPVFLLVLQWIVTTAKNWIWTWGPWLGCPFEVSRPPFQYMADNTPNPALIQSTLKICQTPCKYLSLGFTLNLDTCNYQSCNNQTLILDLDNHDFGSDKLMRYGVGSEHLMEFGASFSQWGCLHMPQLLAEAKSLVSLWLDLGSWLSWSWWWWSYTLMVG